MITAMTSIELQNAMEIDLEIFNYEFLNPLPVISSIHASSPQSTEKDLGPDLEPLGWSKRLKFILGHIFRHRGIQIILMVLAMLALFFVTRAWNELSLPVISQNATTIPLIRPTSWSDLFGRLQSYLSVGTLLVAIAVWYGEVRNEWESGLQNRMSVFFFYEGRPVIVCRYVWLAGEGDMRAWGQQVARQTIEGQKQLDFSPDIDFKKSLAVWTDGKPCMHYSVLFRLTKLNDVLKMHQGECQYQNMASRDQGVRPVPVAQVERLREVSDWATTSRS